MFAYFAVSDAPVGAPITAETFQQGEITTILSPTRVHTRAQDDNKSHSNESLLKRI